MRVRPHGRGVGCLSIGGWVRDREPRPRTATATANRDRDCAPRPRTRLPVCHAVLILLPMTWCAILLGADCENFDDEIRTLDEIVFLNSAKVSFPLAGTIQSETADELVIKRGGATSTIKVAQIQSKKLRRSAEQVYRDFRACLDATQDLAGRAKLNERIGLWCVLPLAVLGGEPPLRDRALDHLIKTVEIDPARTVVYPHILDLLAEERDRAAGGIALVDKELWVFSLARGAGFTSPEMDFREAELLLDRYQLVEEAQKRFERVVREATEGAPGQNFALRRKAIRRLAAVHREAGEHARANQLFALDAGNGEAGGFESNFELARWHARRNTPEDRKRARELFEKAREIQKDLPQVTRELAALDFAEGKFSAAAGKLLTPVQDGVADAGLRLDLALVWIRQGHFGKAKKLLDTLIDAPPPELQPTPEELALARLGRGLVLQYRGRERDALAEFRAALELHPASVSATVLTAGAELRAGDRARSQELLGALVKSQGERPGVFPASARLLAEAFLLDEKPRRAINLLEYAVDSESRDPILRRNLGVLLLGQNEIGRAAQHLEAAQKLTQGHDADLIAALGALAYKKGDYAGARSHFQRVTTLVSRPVPNAQGKLLRPVPPVRLYAEMGLAAADDAQRLEVWVDDFERGTSSDVARNWREEERFGIQLTVKESRLSFQGEQTNDPVGVTMVVREEPAENVERLSVRLRFDGKNGAVRAGLRLETGSAPGAPPSAGLVLFRDRDGKLTFARKTSRAGWEDAVVTPDQEPLRGKPVFAGDMVWPDDGQFHTLLIRRTPKPLGAIGATASSGYFDLLFDGKPVAQNIAVEGLRGKTYQVGVSCQAEGLGSAARFEADDFTLYREIAIAQSTKER